MCLTPRVVRLTRSSLSSWCRCCVLDGFQGPPVFLLFPAGAGNGSKLPPPAGALILWDSLGPGNSVFGALTPSSSRWRSFSGRGARNKPSAQVACPTPGPDGPAPFDIERSCAVAVRSSMLPLSLLVVIDVVCLSLSSSTSIRGRVDPKGWRSRRVRSQSICRRCWPVCRCCHRCDDCCRCCRCCSGEPGRLRHE